MPTPQTGLLDLALASPDADPARLARLRQVDTEFTLDAAGLPSHPVVRRGDVWLCGRHRVACGDATSAADVDRALGGLQPILMVTDPPYGVEYDPSWREKYDMFGRESIGKVIYDNRNDWRAAWVLFPGDVAYVWHAGKYSSKVQASLDAAGFEVRSQIIWSKPRFVFSRGNYHWQHEPLWYAVREGKSSSWSGGHDQSTIWHIPNSNPIGGKRADVTGHGTQKPLECMRRPIANHDAPVVYDPFLGSGTTLIAAELEGRACVGVELNPLYVYIAVDRWQKATGLHAALETTGETLYDVAERREREPEAPEPAAKTPSNIPTVTLSPKQVPTSNGHAENTNGRGLFDLFAEIEAAPVSSVFGPPDGRVAMLTHAEPVTLTSRAAGLKDALLSAPTTPTHISVVTITPRGAPAASITFTARPLAAPTDPFLEHHAKRLQLAGNARLAFDETTWWDNQATAPVGLDCEVFKNFFCACFKRFSDGKRLAFELSPRQPMLDADGIEAVLRGNVIVTFNGKNYDLHVLAAALMRADNAALYDLSQAIIVCNERPRGAPFTPPLNHVDLMDPLPQGRRSLKEIHGRLHGRSIVDLPFPPDAELTPQQMNVATLYCMNDVDAVGNLREALRGPLEMRHKMGERYGIDLRSRSDSQMGEDIFRARLARPPNRSEPVQSVNYAPPAFLKFAGEMPNEILRSLSDRAFAIDAGGHVVLPDWLESTVVKIGETDYRMGVGGIHSQESHRALRSDAERFLLDVDVGSQYPNIALKLGLYPAAVGPEFLTIFKDMVAERLEAKAAGDRVVADGLKIACNGSGFGKTGSMHSFLYAPHLFLGITLTGQLSLLMLAERAELAGVPVVSANTDGVVFHCPRNREAALDEVLTGWEADVGMGLERTRYDALYSSSVNCYIALKEGGGTKRKGWVANPWADGDLRGMLSKNPQMTILSDAAVALLAEGVPVEETIAAAFDPRAFVTLIKVAGGASWRGQPLGRAVRWYWSTDGEAIVYTSNGRRVAKTEGAAPLMEMTDQVPRDLNRGKYVDEAHRLLVDIGAERAPGLL